MTSDLRDPVAFGHYLNRHIPISAAMGVKVVSSRREEVILHAPLKPNVNHRATVFGGSASALAVLAAWTWLHLALREAGFTARVVIQRNQMEYLAPIDGDFTAHCAGLAPAEFERHVRTLRRHGKARAKLTSELRLHDRVVAEFVGEYVAMITPPADR